MMRTTLPYSFPEEAASHAWPLTSFRHRPFGAAVLFLLAGSLTGWCIYKEAPFLLSLLPVALQVMATYNLIDLTTRLFDEGRRIVGIFLAMMSAGAALSLIPALFYLFLSWLFVTS